LSITPSATTSLKRNSTVPGIPLPSFLLHSNLRESYDEARNSGFCRSSFRALPSFVQNRPSAFCFRVGANKDEIIAAAGTPNSFALTPPLST